MLKKALSAAHLALSPSRKYWIFIAGISGMIFGVILLSVLGSWLNLAPEEQASLARLADRILPFPFIGAFVLVWLIGGLVTLLFRYYITPILQLAEATQLISLANPNHRIQTKGAREVALLAEMINSSADAYQRLQQEVGAAIQQARAEVVEERNRLVALMSELPAGVVVCNSDGQILLYNHQAQNMLQPSNQIMAGQGGWIGIGRSIYSVLQKEPIVDGLKRLQAALAQDEARPSTKFMVLTAGQHSLRATMAPVMGYGTSQPAPTAAEANQQISGVVLTLEDLSPQAAPGLPKFYGPRPVYYEFDLFNQQSSQELGSRLLRKLTYVVFDTETTGLNPAEGDEILQLGAVRIVNGRVRADEKFDQLVDPKRPIPAASMVVHGITPEMVLGQPTIEQVLPCFHAFAEGAVLVAHNAAFDMRCLQLKAPNCGVRFDQPVLDTLLLSSIIHPHHETHSLDSIAARLDFSIGARHSAYGDALATAEILLRLLPLLEAQGIMTLEDALRESAKSRYAKLAY